MIAAITTETCLLTCATPEAFKFLVLGMIAEIKRKSLPAIAQSVGLPNAQSLHHFLQQAAWQVEDRPWATIMVN